MDGANPRREPQTPGVAVTVGVPVGTLLAGDSPRTVHVDESHAQALAHSGRTLPPLLVHRPTMRVIDGTDRLRAAVLRGQDTVGVTFFDGSAEDAFVLSVQANISHGLPLTQTERTSAALRILRSHPDWSDRGIARRTGLAARTVATLRRREPPGPAPPPVPPLGRGQPLPELVTGLCKDLCSG